MLIPVPRQYRKPRGKATRKRPLPIPPVVTAATYVTATRVELKGTIV